MHGVTIKIKKIYLYVFTLYVAYFLVGRKINPQLWYGIKEVRMCKYFYWSENFVLKKLVK